jgi:hypothetical protein
LRFQKNNCKETCFKNGNNGKNVINQNINLKILDHLLKIKLIILDIIIFKTKINKNNFLNKDPDSEFWIFIL